MFRSTGLTLIALVMASGCQTVSQYSPMRIWRPSAPVSVPAESYTSAEVDYPAQAESPVPVAMPIYQSQESTQGDDIPPAPSFDSYPTPSRTAPPTLFPME
ncbi:hypothetical protein SH668x_001105 [Planctomicrobium sp. SH668]|uniref:hypothetical protein n=1 Tax=Planctomicrobium sp. SH668 TaxID=3448126 RepID=UPI003F5B58FA